MYRHKALVATCSGSVVVGVGPAGQVDVADEGILDIAGHWSRCWSDNGPEAFLLSAWEAAERSEI